MILKRFLRELTDLFVHSPVCRCDVLKLAMIKNSFMAEKLFQGEVYDCMCKYERAASCSLKKSPSPQRQLEHAAFP